MTPEEDTLNIEQETNEIQQLIEAEKLAFQSNEFFDQILDKTISICLTTSQTRVRLQRQCLNFIYKSFYLKQIESFELRCKNSIKLIDLLDYFILQSKNKLDNYLIIQRCIDILNSVYDLIFFEMVQQPDEGKWIQLTNIRDHIIGKWPSSYPLLPYNKETDYMRSIGCKNSMVKLMGKIIQTHLPGTPGDNADISTRLLPPEHLFLESSTLSTHAQLLLDMLLGFLNDDVLSSTALFSTIISTLMVLFKTRSKYLSTKLINFILGYESQLKRNPKYEVNQKIKMRLIRRFNDRIDKCLIAFLLNKGFINKDLQLKTRFENKYRYLVEKATEQKERGILNDEIDDEGDEEVKRIKRRKLEAQKSQRGNASYFYNEAEISRSLDYKDIYSLINPNDELGQFDASSIPIETLINMVGTALSNVETDKMVRALGIVFERYKYIAIKPGETFGPQPRQQQYPQNSQQNNTEYDDEDDDYDPTYEGGTGAATTIKPELPPSLKPEEFSLNSMVPGNLLDSEATLANDEKEEDEDDAEAYILALPRQLAAAQKKEHLRLIINSFIKLSSFNQIQSSVVSTTQPVNDLKKVAIPNWNNESWIRLLSRLAARGLNNEELSTVIREALFNHFKLDLKNKVDDVIEWLNEEYYSSSINYEGEKLEEGKYLYLPSVYLHYTTMILDNLIPFLESTDRKIFIRLLSELPYLNKDLIWRIRSLCSDPVRSKLGFQSLLYLIMFRPPVIRDCIELLKDMYRDSGSNESLKSESLNYLKKYAPAEDVSI